MVTRSSKSSEINEILKLVGSRPICKPLLNLAEMMSFLEDPPPWRTLGQELTPHSDYMIRNSDVNTRPGSLNSPEVFCHYDLDCEEVKRTASKSLPKTLVCHDMANGYHDDCIIDGTCNSEAYTFYNWGGIDIFCYFSHHLITIPPVGWINIGHAHGVKVIGTVITEHSDGVTFWDEVLSSESQYQNMASALVAVAKAFKFDGYLLNVENKISNPDALLSFVGYFHRLLHDELPHATLLWYDSVTVSGKLHWQNALNAENRAFFDACDGLFTNYSWTPEDVKSSAEQAADRLTDLYIGIDVWGRNFYGGGKFNTREAIKVARDAGCSIAVFAPAWTQEALATDCSAGYDVAMAEELSNYDKFLLRDRALWSSFWVFLNTKLPCHMPFQTSFCRGHGRQRYLYGEVLSPSPWFNLRHQQYQPNAAHGPHGFLLSTIEKLNKVSREFKEKKGIMRIRNSFQSDDGQLAEPEPGASVSREISAKDVKSVISLKAETNDDANEPSELFERPGVMEASVSVRLGRKHTARWGLARVAREHQCLELHLEDAFTGGACLMVHPSDKLSPDHRITRLFHCDFRCDEGIIVCVVTKKLYEHPQQTLNVRLTMLNASREELLVVLAGRSLAQTAQLDGGSAGIQYVYPLRTADEDVLRQLRSHLLLTQPGFYVPLDNVYGWNVRYYEVSVPGSRVTAVNLRTALASGPILLGYFGIAQKPFNTPEA